MKKSGLGLSRNTEMDFVCAEPFRPVATPKAKPALKGFVRSSNRYVGWFNGQTGSEGILMDKIHASDVHKSCFKLLGAKFRSPVLGYFNFKVAIGSLLRNWSVIKTKTIAKYSLKTGLVVLKNLFQVVFSSLLRPGSAGEAGFHIFGKQNLKTKNDTTGMDTIKRGAWHWGCIA